jgi:hypothetical protein
VINGTKVGKPRTAGIVLSVSVILSVLLFGCSSSSSKSSSATSTSSTSASASSSSSSSVPASAGSTRGVTSNSVKVGIAILSLAAFKSYGPAYYTGDPQQMAAAILAGWEKQHLVPINGRNVQFVYSTYYPSMPATERATCVDLIQDQHVFMVQASFTFFTGSDCVSRENHTPVVTTDGLLASQLDSDLPYLFTLFPTQDRILRNVPYWGQSIGIFAGKKIGVYYAGDSVNASLVQNNLINNLKKLGFDVAATATTTGAAINNSLAVQRFMSAGVNLVIFAIPSEPTSYMTARAGFLQQAVAQGYHPTFVDSDYGSGVTNTTTSTFPTTIFNGAYGMSTWASTAQASAGQPLNAEEAACDQTYQQYSGISVTPAQPAEWEQLQTMCSTLDNVVLPALKAAGSNLTTQSFIQAVESIKNAPAGIFPNLTFSQANHAAGTQWLTARWYQSCKCWQAPGGFSPMAVP